MLLKFEDLFDGTLGDWKLPPMTFELRRKVQHHITAGHTQSHKYTRPYSVLMKEIDKLCEIRVLEWQPSSRWASPTFIIPKKDATVRKISDFRELNKHIAKKPYPIPKISTTLQELEGFTYATALDLNMGYYITTPSDWTQQRPRCAQPSFRRVNTLIRGCPWAGPDGMPGICTSLH